MKKTNQYAITFFGEFTDMTLEREFFQNYMKHCSGFIRPMILMFGIIYMLFSAADYFTVGTILAFRTMLLIRFLFLSVSVVIYLYLKKIDHYRNMADWITVYEIWAVVSFMAILYQYDSLDIISCFSVMAITLALYIIPNKMIHAQIVSILFNLAFFLLFAGRITGVDTGMLYRILTYALIFILFGNAEALIANFYRRKQFADRAELLKLYLTDPLTGIYNRVRFDQELKQWIEYCNRYASLLSLVMFDIDDFKKINDSYGHLGGDKILKSIAAIIKNAVRSTDVFARWGGDEFVILLPHTDMQQAMEMTQRLKVYIKENRYDGMQSVTCSFGLVSFQKDETAESMLQKVDRLLYQAKKHGKNTIALANDGEDAEIFS